MRRLTTLVALLALAGATMGQDSCGTETEDAATDTEETTRSSSGEDKSTTPDPEASVESNCDYLLDFDSGSKFIAGGTITNTGNIGVVVRFSASWTLLGSTPVRAEKRVRIRPGQEREVQLARPASTSQIDAHQSADGKCKADGTIVDTFGKPQS